MVSKIPTSVQPEWKQCPLRRVQVVLALYKLGTQTCVVERTPQRQSGEPIRICCCPVADHIMASNARSLYQRYLHVITRWPLDSAKEGRDLGTRIRARLSTHFPKGELTQLAADQQATLEKEINSLERIAGNFHQQAHKPIQPLPPASGLAYEVLKTASSTHFIESLNSLHDAGWWGRTKFRVYSMFK